jgi:hypothetical protein
VHSTAGSYIIDTKTGAGGLIVEAAASGRAAVATVRRFLPHPHSTYEILPASFNSRITGNPEVFHWAE